MSLPGKNINPFAFSFGLNTENQQKISFISENKNNNNKISLFNQKDNNSGISFMNSPNNNNDNKGNFSLFNKPNFKDFLNNKSTDKLFLNNDKENENEVLFDNLNISNSKFFSGNETFKQYNNINNINNINNNYANNDNKDNLNTNNVIFLSNDKQNKNNIIKNNDLYENNIFSRTNNRINKDNNNDKIINNEKNDENKNININNNNIVENNNKNLGLDNNQNFKLSECKDLNDYEKTQLLYKTNDEILEDLKSLLFLQQEKFKKCVENTRLLEERYHQLTKINEKKARDSMNNLIKYEKIISELNLLSENSNSLKQILSIKTDIMGDALEYLKKNNNYNTKNTFAQTVDIDDSSSLYSELKNTSGKLRKIDNDLKVITNTMHKNEKNIIDRSYNIYDKNNINNIIINGQGINDDTGGVWIERENIRDKIYIEQKDMDNLFNDCYNGLNNFRSEQEEFDMKYDLLKSKLIDKINQNNNKNTNLRNNNDNSKYNIINNINNNINNNNINIIPNNIMINNNAFI
jgi:hypothetical protein